MPENRQNTVLLCAECRSAVAVSPGPLCGRCSMPVPATWNDPARCPRCQGRKIHYESTLTLGLYQGVLRDIVLRMKKTASEPLSRAMGEVLATKVRQQSLEADLIICVPMHWSRRLLRGANPSELLSATVSGSLRISTRERLLTCRRNTKKQGTLSARDRLANVRGAYGLSAGYDINGAKILLIDDVMTTGATANEVARVCRKNGAESVNIAVIARGTGVN